MVCLERILAISACVIHIGFCTVDEIRSCTMYHCCIHHKVYDTMMKEGCFKYNSLIPSTCLQ